MGWPLESSGSCTLCEGQAQLLAVTCLPVTDCICLSINTAYQIPGTASCALNPGCVMPLHGVLAS